MHNNFFIYFFFTAQKHVEPYIKPIALELLNIIRETENDDLTNVMQKIVCTYTKQLTPIAVEMTQHLVSVCFLCNIDCFLFLFQLYLLSISVSAFYFTLLDRFF